MNSDAADFAVGFIGLGNIGAPMAKRLVDWPGGLWVFDVAESARRAFDEAGAHVAASVGELAERTQVISVMVRDDAQVRDVVVGPGGIADTAAAGTVVAVHSTIAPDTATELAAELTGSGIEIVDAPVSGGAMGAATAELAAMVGGSDAAVEKFRPVFERWASLVAHLGPLGAGTRAKLARNLLHFVSFTAVAEASRVAEAGGVDLKLLGEVVRHSDRVTGGPGAIMLRDTADPLAEADGLRPIFTHTRDLGEKDLRHACELATDLDVPTPLADTALPFLAAALGVPHDEETP